MAANIATVGDRKKLVARPAPYFQRLEQGGFVGYRKNKDGTGTWVVRWRNEDGKQINRTLGHFDTFDQATKAAREWIENAKGGVIEDVTVREACRRYVEDRRREKGNATAEDAEGRFRRTVYGSKFGEIRLNNLRTAQIIDWRNSQVGIQGDEDDPDSERRAKDSANRNLATLKAALNLAYRNALVGSTAQWDRVRAFEGVGKRRDRFLTSSERRQILAVAAPDLKRLILATLYTAARPGEIASATIGCFDKTGYLTLDGKTGRRIIPLSPDAIAHLGSCAEGRGSCEPLVVQHDGRPWTRYEWRDSFQAARTAAGLGDDVVMYSFRHCAISEMLVAGIDPLSVARLAGTSIAMIQNHYGHLIKDKVVTQLATVKMI